MRRSIFVLLVLLTLLFLYSVWHPPSSAGTKAIHFGKVIDGQGRVWNDAVVLVSGDRIRSILVPSAQIPADAVLVDLRPLTAIPGLIDVHTHMTYALDPSAVPQNARNTLEAGVTTVRDLGAANYDDIVLRDGINRGEVVGPRMLVAGYGITAPPPRAHSTEPPDVSTADGPAEVARAVRRQIAAGADVVKMFASTGSGYDLSGQQTFTFDEIKSAVDTAHQYGKRIAVHSYGPNAAHDAVRAGADSIEHATDMDEATLAEMAHRGTFYVPTIDHNRYYMENRQLFSGPDISSQFQDFIRRNLDTTRRAHRAGVRLAMGSDAIFTMYGQNTRELGWFVKAGMTAEQALASATRNAASLLGMEDRLGAIAPGYYADIVAIDGDPLSDVNAVTQGIRWVMKGGKVVVDKTH